jgi:dihydrofolate reductase
VSRTLKSVGPNATLIAGELGAAIKAIKAAHQGEIEVAGPQLAQSLGELGLVDEYQIYFRPYVLGRGKPYFAAPPGALQLLSSDLIGEDAVKLTYAPASNSSGTQS